MRNDLILLVLVCSVVLGQDTVAVLDGSIKDPALASVSGAEISITNAQTGLTLNEHSARDGSFHFSTFRWVSIH